MTRKESDTNLYTYNAQSLSVCQNADSTLPVEARARPKPLYLRLGRHVVTPGRLEPSSAPLW